MTLAALRDDALSSTTEGFEIRLSLPWIRSLPLASLDGIEVVVDSEPVDVIRIALADRLLDPVALLEEPAWWYMQDRVVLRGAGTLRPGAHDVAISFRLVIPYLQAGPDGPLALPFGIHRSLVLDAPASAPSVSRDVA
jgi:hypothetical protein